MTGTPYGPHRATVDPVGKVTASPPSSRHQVSRVACRGSRVLISSARPDSAVARSAYRNSSSKAAGSNGPAEPAGQERTG